MRTNACDPNTHQALQDMFQHMCRYSSLWSSERDVITFVLFLIFHFCAGDSSKWICFCLNSFLINLCYSLSPIQMYLIQKEWNPPDRCLFAKVSTLVPSEKALLVKVHDLLTDLLCHARRGHIHDQLLCILLENARGSNSINSTKSYMAFGKGTRRSAPQLSPSQPAPLSGPC